MTRKPDRRLFGIEFINEAQSSMKTSRVLTTGLLLALFSTMVLTPVSAYAVDADGETVTIRNDGDNTFYEFRVNGELVEIKVVPKQGPSYYLVPSSQNANDFVRKDNPDIVVPSWVIFRW
jgi:hypothetical protein